MGEWSLVWNEERGNGVGCGIGGGGGGGIKHPRNFSPQVVLLQWNWVWNRNEGMELWEWG